MVLIRTIIYICQLRIRFCSPLLRRLPPSWAPCRYSHVFWHVSRGMSLNGVSDLSVQYFLHSIMHPHHHVVRRPSLSTSRLPLTSPSTLIDPPSSPAISSSAYAPLNPPTHDEPPCKDPSNDCPRTPQKRYNGTAVISMVCCSGSSD